MTTTPEQRVASELSGTAPWDTLQGTGRIALALAAFQAEVPVVGKGNQAEVSTKSGGKYTYTYANLADISAVALPLLAKQGLAFTCVPRAVERGFVLEGQLLHESGESISGVLPLTSGTPQEMGSAITYMRRYMLGCLTGLVTDDDDDGAAANQAARRQQQQERTPTVPPEEPVDKHDAAIRAAAAAVKAEGNPVALGKIHDRAQILGILNESVLLPDPETGEERDQALGPWVTRAIGRTRDPKQ